jgi:hypothetical protein
MLASPRTEGGGQGAGRGGAAAAAPACDEAAHAPGPAIAPVDGVGDDQTLHMRGLSLAAISAFVERCGGRRALAGMTTDEVVEGHLKPLTHAGALSYCELLEALEGESGGGGALTAATSSQPPLIAVPTVFVSHAWQHPFLDLVDALEGYEEAAATASSAACEGVATTNHQHFYWVDLLCNNQHTAPGRPHTWWANGFRASIAAIGRVALVLQLRDPVPLRRAWCLWECACACDLRVPFDVALSRAQEAEAREALTRDFDALVAVLAGVDVARAGARVEADRAKILAAVEAGVGCAAVNVRVAGLLRQWLLGTAERLLAAAGAAEAARRADALAVLFGSTLDASALASEDEGVRAAVLDARVPPRSEADVLAEAGLATAVGRLQQLCGSHAPALAALQRAEQVAEAGLGPDHPATLQCRSRAAAALLTVPHGDLEDAAAALSSVLAAKQACSALGPGHPSTLRTAHDLATALDRLAGRERRLDGGLLLQHEAGRAAAAAASEARWRSLVADLARACGEDHASVFAARVSLCRSLLRSGRVRDAVHESRAALATAAVALPGARPEVMDLQLCLADALLTVPRIRGGDDASAASYAVDLLLRVFDGAAATLGPSSPHFLAAVHALRRAQPLYGRLPPAVAAAATARLAQAPAASVPPPASTAAAYEGGLNYAVTFEVTYVPPAYALLRLAGTASPAAGSADPRGSALVAVSFLHHAGQTGELAELLSDVWGRHVRPGEVAYVEAGASFPSPAHAAAAAAAGHPLPHPARSLRAVRVEEKCEGGVHAALLTLYKGVPARVLPRLLAVVSLTTTTAREGNGAGADGAGAGGAGADGGAPAAVTLQELPALIVVLRRVLAEAERRLRAEAASDAPLVVPGGEWRLGSGGRVDEPGSAWVGGHRYLLARPARTLHPVEEAAFHRWGEALVRLAPDCTAAARDDAPAWKGAATPPTFSSMADDLLAALEDL